MAIRIEPTAMLRIREIYLYSRDQWGESRADSYVRGLHAAFDRIASGTARSRQLPAEFGLPGFLARHERHVIHWRHLPNGDIGILTVLHERMHQIRRFRDDLPR